MASMAATLASSLPAANAKAAPAASAPKRKDPSALNVPARMEEALDVQGEMEITEVELSGMVVLKLLKHSSDPAQPQPQSSSSANYQGRERENHHANDAVGLLLGLDLSGVMEVSDSFALPAVDASGKGEKLDANSYPSQLLRHLREVSSPDNVVGVYISTHSAAFSTSGNAGVGGTGGFLTRGVVELMGAVERLQGGRGKPILIVHDSGRSIGGDVSIKAYKFTEGFNAALQKQKFDSSSLIESRLTPSTLLQPLTLRTKNPALLSALYASLTTPTAPVLTNSLRNPSLPALPPSFLPLENTIPTALPSSLSTTLSALNTLSQETNNLAYQSRQIAREKSKHDQAVQQRADENELRRKQGLQPLPEIPEPRGGKLQEPSRLEMLSCLGMVDAAAKGLAAEAGKGMAKVYASG